MRTWGHAREHTMRRPSVTLILWRKAEDQAGLSLAEELVALGLIAAGIIFLLYTISTGALGVRIFRDHVSAEGLARTQLEMIKEDPFRADPTAVPYSSVSPSPPYSITVEVEYWVAPSGPWTSTVTADGMQRVTVTVFRDAEQVLSLQELKVDR